MEHRIAKIEADVWDLKARLARVDQHERERRSDRWFAFIKGLLIFEAGVLCTIYATRLAERIRPPANSPPAISATAPPSPDAAQPH